MKRGDDPARRRDQGRYAVEQRCDACRRPIHGEYCTDDEVCQGTDGPGFFLCTRKACGARYAHLSVAERLAYFVQHALADRPLYPHYT